MESPVPKKKKRPGRKSQTERKRQYEDVTKRRSKRLKPSKQEKPKKFRDQKIKKGEQGVIYGEHGMSKITMRPRVHDAVKSFPAGLSAKEIRKKACEKIPFFPSKSVVRSYQKMNPRSTESKDLKEDLSFRVQRKFVNQSIVSEDESSDVESSN